MDLLFDHAIRHSLLNLEGPYPDAPCSAKALAKPPTCSGCRCDAAGFNPTMKQLFMKFQFHDIVLSCSHSLSTSSNLVGMNLYHAWQ
jgi:hypothetical protein